MAPILTSSATRPPSRGIPTSETSARTLCLHRSKRYANTVVAQPRSATANEEFPGSERVYNFYRGGFSVSVQELLLRVNGLLIAAEN